MKKKLFTLIMMLISFSIQIFAQMRDYTAMVVDAETDEALPYVNIYLRKGEGTITNDDGFFTIECLPEDTIQLSYIGYEKMSIAISDFPQTIRMRPLSTEMDEVMVEPTEAILMKVIQRLNKEYKKRKKVTGEYFYRLTNHARENPELIEAVLEARNAVSLRNIKILNGRHFCTIPQGTQADILKFTNLYHTLEIGPAFNSSPFWTGTVAPLNKKEHLDSYGYIYKGDYEFAKYYDITQKSLFTSAGERIYKIEMRDKGLWKQDYILCGTLYVDARTYQLLRFEGELKNLHINIHNDYSQELVPASLVIDMGYDHTEGFTQVKYMSSILKSGNEQCRSLLFKREQEDREWDNKVKSTENILADIQLAGYDSIYWEKNLIQRTRDEEIIVMKAHPELYRIAYSPLLVQKASQSRAFGKELPQEFVYVHMDNNCYFPGDTLYYKIYAVRSDKGKPSDISRVAYAELFNHEGYLVERQTIHLDNGQGHGAFDLDTLLSSGFYELRVYTRWQLNWGVYDHPHTPYAGKWFLNPQMKHDFFRDYEKLYSRVFPIFEKTEVEGDFKPQITLRQTKSEDSTLSVGIYPEGGAWVQGVWQRIAFEARDKDGKYLSGMLSVYDENKRLVTRKATLHRGKGLFDIKGERGKKYTAVFTTENGYSQNIDLPKMEKQGVSLQVDNVNDYARIRIEQQGLDDTPLGICIMHNGIQKFFRQIDLPEILVPADSLPTGVSQFTVFDEKGKVWADRLAFFHRERLTSANICAEGIPTKAKPYAPINITIKGLPDSRISLSVKDKEREGRTNDNGTLMSELLLCSQIRGFIESPMYYFYDDNPTRQQHLDLLLMTQGWRRFKWEEMSMGMDLSHPAEKNTTIEGEVYAYSPLDQEDAFFSVPFQDLHRLQAENNGGSGGPVLTERLEALSPESHSFMKNEEGYDIYKIFTSNKADLMQNQWISKLNDSILVHVEAVKPGEKGFVGNILTDKKFTFSLPQTSGKYHLYLSAAKTRQGSDYTNWIVQNPDKYPNYNIRIKSFYPRFVKPYEYYQCNLPDSTNIEIQASNSRKNEKNNNEDIVLNTKPAIVMDAYTAFNQTVDAGLSSSWYAGSLTYSINVARLLLQDMGLTESYILERRWDGRNISENIPPKEQFKYNHLEYLDKISIYTDYSPRMKGLDHMKANGKRKVIFNMQAVSDGHKRTAYRDRYFQMNGYNVCKDFYSPDYSKQTPPDSIKDYRRTLYWNPNLMLDKDGKATVTLYNNARTTQISVDAAGQAADGTLLWGEDPL